MVQPTRKHVAHEAQSIYHVAFAGAVGAHQHRERRQGNVDVRDAAEILDAQTGQAHGQFGALGGGFGFWDHSCKSNLLRNGL
ncbi:hypothetical protein AXW84_08930 [Hymenobacter sp. PAMC 26628]|nr:hypothetical protein AXW84_08930 [Hymenobacter sp. PAMC 26628]